MCTLWGADPNALHVHTNFRVHMLGVAFLHMYTGIIILMLQLKYSSRLECRCPISWMQFMAQLHTLIWHPLYLSTHILFTPNSSFAMLCAIFHEFKYINLSSTLLSHQAPNQAYTCCLTSCLVPLLNNSNQLTDNTWYHLLFGKVMFQVMVHMELRDSWEHI